MGTARFSIRTSRALATLLLLFAEAYGDIKGTWSDGDPAQSLCDIHLLGAATLLQDGRVIAAGGLNR